LYGLCITHPSVPRLGLTNFPLWRFLEFKRNWLFERRLSSNQQLETLPYSHLIPVVLLFLIPLSQDFSIPALFLLWSHYPITRVLWLSQQFDFSDPAESQHFCDPTIPTLWLLSSPTPKTSRYTIPTLWILWSCYLSTSRSLNPPSALLTDLTIPGVSFYSSDPNISTI
jgi:hypothetical protein